ncbi:hypothetical protein GCM10010988_28920 [Cnuibacter physcomitrellae]|uniref:Uncharacterized protein n=1 Tax=Cnuibacter physcomitrellae TaxID=1619308 RepID=A0A1X9LGA0_9MICO|nr:DUF4190 domain-containing protein [Cnuibacter physcomitrellae]ARJ04163.1 hypothetical protein B5808_02165 [Cnuibacter physcomitrellae]GGI40406.1 hypothetical protein GCM10010988_28920 [Cnuibacter physcomitrellae]
MTVTTPTSSPGRVLGIVGLILAFLTPVIGLILSIIALVQSKKAGVRNGLALVGVIVGAALTAAIIAVIVIASVTFGGRVGTALDLCAQNGPGTYTQDGTTITCD